MIKKAKFILGMMAFIIVSAGMLYSEADDNSMFATINLRIEQDSNEIWRVRDLNGNSRGSFVANVSDNIQWQNRGPQVVFLFSEDVGDYFEFREGLFQDGRSQIVEPNANLRVSIKEDAPKGELIYEIYVISEGKIVQGNSAPRMIIQ